MQHASFHFTDYQPVTPAQVATRHVAALDLSLVDATPTQAITALLAPGRRRVCFVNAHYCNVMHNDPQYNAAVRSADMRLPDGFGVELAARMSGGALTANLNGTDLIPSMLQEASLRGQSVYLFGSAPGTAEAAARKLLTQIPTLRIAGTRDGYAGAENEAAAIADINASGADILLVGMGAPLQELWLQRNADLLTPHLIMGVGAALDFLAGSVSRAPKWVRAAKSEWVWRLAMEPKRLAKRYLAGNASFLARAGMRRARQIRPDAVVSRGLDITIAGLALLLLAPLFVLTALAIRTESKGPAFFKQTRVGKNGKTFTLYKFRSMGVDAEARRAALLTQSDREGVCFKSKTDPRITRVGRIIRRFSIDELPQVINVLRGEMAIVGPRPALPCEVAAYPTRALGRLAVKPGLTGIWQVSGRADIGFDQMIDMDLAYTASRSVLLDVMLIAMTFQAVLSGRGAH